jgi:hypothetical protein
MKKRTVKSHVNSIAILSLLLITSVAFSQQGPNYLYGEDVKFKNYINNIVYYKINTNKEIVKNNMIIYNIENDVDCIIMQRFDKIKTSKIKIFSYFYSIDSILWTGNKRNQISPWLSSCYFFFFNGQKYISLFIGDVSMTTSKPITKLVIFKYSPNPQIVLNEWQCRNNLDGLGFMKNDSNKFVYLKYDCRNIVEEFVYTVDHFIKKKEHVVEKRNKEIILSEID